MQSIFWGDERFRVHFRSVSMQICVRGTLTSYGNGPSSDGGNGSKLAQVVQGWSWRMRDVVGVVSKRRCWSCHMTWKLAQSREWGGSCFDSDVRGLDCVSLFEIIWGWYVNAFNNSWVSGHRWCRCQHGGVMKTGGYFPYVLLDWSTEIFSILRSSYCCLICLQALPCCGIFLLMNR